MINFVLNLVLNLVIYFVDVFVVVKKIQPLSIVDEYINENLTIENYLDQILNHDKDFKYKPPKEMVNKKNINSSN